MEHRFISSLTTTQTFEIVASDAFVLQTVNMDTYLNNTSLFLRFHYLASWGNYWALDNVTVKGTSILPCTINYWEGTVNTAWENAANWSCGTIPVYNTEVQINSGKSNYPVITSMATCKSLLTQPGAEVQVSTGFSLDITGP